MLSWQSILKDVDLQSISNTSNITAPQRLQINNTPDLSTVERNHKICINCQGPLTLKDNYTICQTCGVESYENAIDGDTVNCVETHKSDESPGYVSLRIVGKGSKHLQKIVLKTGTNYEKHRCISSLKELRNLNSKNTGITIPKTVIREANDMFTQIVKAKYVFRKDHKKGVISACLYYACYNNKIARTRQELARYLEIEEKFHSQGDRILHDLNEQGIISIPTGIFLVRQYIEMFLELLEIDKKYTDFIENLINYAESKNLHLLNDSKNNTKCIGAIYVLIQRFPAMRKRVTIEKIENICKISKTTINRYNKMVHKFYRKFKVVFKRHAIPMPAAWRH